MSASKGFLIAVSRLTPAHVQLELITSSSTHAGEPAGPAPISLHQRQSSCRSFDGDGPGDYRYLLAFHLGDDFDGVFPDVRVARRPTPRAGRGIDAHSIEELLDLEDRRGTVRRRQFRRKGDRLPDLAGARGIVGCR